MGAINWNLRPSRNVEGRAGTASSALTHPIKGRFKVVRIENGQHVSAGSWGSPIQVAVARPVGKGRIPLAVVLKGPATQIAVEGFGGLDLLHVDLYVLDGHLQAIIGRGLLAANADVVAIGVMEYEAGQFVFVPRRDIVFEVKASCPQFVVQAEHVIGPN